MFFRVFYHAEIRFEMSDVDKVICGFARCLTRHKVLCVAHLRFNKAHERAVIDWFRVAFPPLFFFSSNAGFVVASSRRATRFGFLTRAVAFRLAGLGVDGKRMARFSRFRRDLARANRFCCRAVDGNAGRRFSVFRVGAAPVVSGFKNRADCDRAAK